MVNMPSLSLGLNISNISVSGRDVLARGRTGSGKTGAFALPAIQKVLNMKTAQTSTGVQAVRVLMMAPTRELAKQIQLVVQVHTYFVLTKQQGNRLLCCSHVM